MVATHASETTCAFPGAFIVKTVLDLDMLSPSQREAILRLDTVMGDHKLFAMLGSPAEAVIEALGHVCDAGGPR